MDARAQCPKIEFQKASMTFITPGGPVEAVREIDLKIGENEIVCVVGPSGCGKSTLVNLVAGFILPTGGRVLTDGRPVGKPGADRAVVFQQDSVFPWLTVSKNLEYGPRARGVSVEDRESTVGRLLDLVDLRQFKDMYPRHLSGGMKKRVDLARAYANEPEILLMDEPFGALDVLTKEKMQRDLLRLWREDARTVVFITHDIEEAIFVGHRIVVLTTRPARVSADIKVPFEKELDTRVKTTRPFQELRQQIIDMLE